MKVLKRLLQSMVKVDFVSDVVILEIRVSYDRYRGYIVSIVSLFDDWCIIGSHIIYGVEKTVLMSHQLQLLL